MRNLQIGKTWLDWLHLDPSDKDFRRKLTPSNNTIIKIDERNNHLRVWIIIEHARLFWQLSEFKQ